MNTEGLQEQLDKRADDELRKNVTEVLSRFRDFATDIETASIFDTPEVRRADRKLCCLNWNTEVGSDDEVQARYVTIKELCDTLPELIVEQYGEEWRRFYTAQFINRVGDLQEAFDDILTMAREENDGTE